LAIEKPALNEVHFFQILLKLVDIPQSHWYKFRKAIDTNLTAYFFGTEYWWHF